MNPDLGPYCSQYTLQNAQADDKGDNYCYEWQKKG